MSIKGSLGETLRTSITHIGPDNMPILGAAFSVLVANRPDDSVFPVTFRELNNGVYEVTVATTVTDPAGEWFLLVMADNGYRYEETFDITGKRAQLLPVPAAPQRGATRQQLRRAVATMLGDLTIAVATTNSTESILTDLINLDREHNAFNGMQIYCADAQQPDNIGRLGTIASNNTITRSVNFNPPLPYPIMEGDVFELYNYRDIGWRFDEYNRAINDAILKGGQEHGAVPHVAILPDAFSRHSNNIEIPVEFARFSGIDVIDEHGAYHKVPVRYYEVDTATCEVRLKGPYLHKADRRKVRIRGHQEPGLLNADSDMTSIPTEWVVAEAVAILVQHDASMGSGRDRLIQFSRSGADGRRPSILTTYGPNTVKLNRG